MRVLLDTNILIHREARTVVREDIGSLFRWLDELKCQKCVHPSSIEEIRKHTDQDVVHTFETKLSSYSVLRTLAPDTSEIAQLRSLDATRNDSVDTSLLAELAAERVDALITEDRGIHAKAVTIGLGQNVYTIDSFLEKVVAENPELTSYRVLSVRKEFFGNINLKDPFFDSFRKDYPGFDRWFNRKSDEPAYVCTTDKNRLLAFLYLKREGPGEDYTDISPAFARASRLKIGTFKVVANGFKLGERFLKIIFDNALLYGVDEIYVTVFRHSSELDRLVHFLNEWGFVFHGLKGSDAGKEEVYVRDFRPSSDLADPRRTYPYASNSARKFIVPIYPAYHTELLPDSILRTESPDDFQENRPNRNAISKVYISRSFERDLHTGDIIVFYRTASGGSAYYTSVATTLGIVQRVIAGIASADAFLAACRRRSVFTDEELLRHWDYDKTNRPFVVNFLYSYSFPRRPNLKELSEQGIIATAPRGFSLLSDEAFHTLMEISDANQRLIIG